MNVNLDQFSNKAAGLPDFGVADIFGKFAAFSDGYTPDQKLGVSLDETLSM